MTSQDANKLQEDYRAYLRMVLTPKMYEKLMEIRIPTLHRWIAEVIRVAKPSSVYVVTNSREDAEYIRRAAIERGEELPTRNPRHTVHFDGPNDLARDRRNTKILIPGGGDTPLLNTYDRDTGLREILSLADGIMKGKEMFIAFYCFGPRDSDFTIYAVQVTDSAYVIHSENILYRPCYDVFVEKAPDISYVSFFHSSGELDGNRWSRNVKQRRIYIDLTDGVVYSLNTQYAGNSVGLKKLMLRLCIYRGYRENWLCEHMFIVGVRGPGGRLTYFTGAFPAGCGKTSTVFTADTVVGDDIAMIRVVDGVARAVNPEVGIFGIIDGINPYDDSEVYQLLTSPDNEVIFSNVLLMNNGEVWWRGKPCEPRPGLNYAGVWPPENVDGEGDCIPPSHPNARFTVSIRCLPNLDPAIDSPQGVPIHAMIFGGRDYHTMPPVEEAFDWIHGVVCKGASLESVKTAAVLEKTGEVEFNPFAILDFLSISLGKFIELHIEFGKRLTVKPKVFSVNYFLRDEQGAFIADKRDKVVWLKWMELRVHGDVEAVEWPTGYIPLYQDLVKLFDRYLGREYSESRYEKEFMLRIDRLITKMERVWSIYSSIPDTPQILFDTMKRQWRRLEDTRLRFGNKVSPYKFDRI